MLRRLLISPDEPRLRAGWRLLVQSLLTGAIVLALILPLMGLQLLGVIGILDLSGAADMAFFSTLAGIASILATWIARRWVDRRTFVSLGFQLTPNALPDLLFGIGVGGVCMAFIFAAQWLLGWLHVEAFAWQVEPAADTLRGMAVFFGLFAAVGFYEELLYRGYYLQNLADGLNLPLALLITSGAFGLIHLGNPNAVWASAMGIFVAGYFLAYGWLRTRQLWIPIGLHIGWNFFQGPVFGFRVSGLDTFRLVRHSVSGPDLVTGGAFGPEAGLIAIPAMALGAFLIWWWTNDERRPMTDDGRRKTTDDR